MLLKPRLPWVPLGIYCFALHISYFPLFYMQCNTKIQYLYPLKISANKTLEQLFSLFWFKKFQLLSFPGNKYFIKLFFWFWTFLNVSLRYFEILEAPDSIRVGTSNQHLCRPVLFKVSVEKDQFFFIFLSVLYYNYFLNFQSITDHCHYVAHTTCDSSYQRDDIQAGLCLVQQDKLLGCCVNVKLW